MSQSVANSCFWLGKRLTAPKHCSRAAYQPGRYGDGGSISKAASSAPNAHCDAGTKGGARTRRSTPQGQNVNIPRLSSFCLQMKILDSLGSVLRWDDSSAGASKEDQCNFSWGVWDEGLRVRWWWGLAAGARSGVKPIANRVKRRSVFMLSSRELHKRGQ